MLKNNFTILRLILASLVMFGHFKALRYIKTGGGIFGYADFAVAAFFVISGYLVYASFDKMPKLKGFYIKRFFRIYPLYAFMIFTQTLVMLALLGDKAEFVDTLQYLASNLVFANFLHYDMGGLLANLPDHGINVSLWTLKIEVMFYLLVPALWWLVRRFGFSALLVIYILSTAYFLIVSNYSAVYAKQLLGQMRFFVVGIGLYLYQNKLIIPAHPIIPIPINDLSFPRRRESWLKTPACAGVTMDRHLFVKSFMGIGIIFKKYLYIPAALILFAICSFRHELPLSIIYPLLVGGLVFICALRLPALPIKNDISYGVYLIHAPLIQLSLLLGFYDDSLWFLLLIVAIVCLLAFIAEKFIELPMIKMGKKYAEKYAQ